MTFKRGKMSEPGWREEACEGALADAQLGPEGRGFCLWSRTAAGKLRLSFHPLLALTARLTQGGSRGTPAGLHNVAEDISLPDEAATGCRGKMKVGLTKGFWGGTLGLGTGKGGRRVEGCSGVEGREDMGVLMVLELVGVVVVVLHLGSVEGLGGRGG